jgi:hypothetical protein
MKSVTDWTDIARIEPALQEMEADVAAGRTTLSKIMLAGQLHHLAGPNAGHPRLRSSAALRSAYARLTHADQQRIDESRATIGV